MGKLRLKDLFNIVDQDLLGIKSFEYLNTQSMYLEFTPAAFSLVEVIRNNQGQIIKAEYEMQERKLPSFFNTLPYKLSLQPSSADLILEFDHDHKALKANLIVSDNETGSEELIEVT